MNQRLNKAKTPRRCHNFFAEGLESRLLLSAASQAGGAPGTISVAEQTVAGLGVYRQIIPVTFFGPNVNVNTFASSNFGVAESALTNQIPIFGVQVGVSYTGLDPTDPGPGQGERIADYAIYKSDANAFTPADDGTYQLFLRPNQVLDTDLGAFAATTSLPALHVDIPPGLVAVTTGMPVDGRLVRSTIPDTVDGNEGASIDFGQTPLNHQGQSRTFTLTNLSADVATISVTENFPDVLTPGSFYYPFNLDSATPIPSSLEPGQSLKFRVTFNAPVSGDAKVGAYGRVVGGFTVSATVPDPSISPDSISFGAFGVLLGPPGTLGATHSSYSFVDAAGDKAKLILAGPGQAALRFSSDTGGPQDPSSLMLNGTDEDTRATLVAKHPISLGTVTVGGPLGSFIAKTATLNGSWTVAGNIGTVSVAAISNTWNAAINGSLGHLIVAGTAGGNLAALSIGSIQAKSLDHANYFAGGYFGADGVPGGGDDRGGPGTIGSITVSGAVVSSNIAAGLAPYENDFFDPSGSGQLDSQDQLTGTAVTSSIGPIRIRGTLSADSKFLAVGYSTARITGVKVNPATDSHFSDGGI